MTAKERIRRALFEASQGKGSLEDNLAHEWSDAAEETRVADRDMCVLLIKGVRRVFYDGPARGAIDACLDSIKQERGG